MRQGQAQVRLLNSTNEADRRRAKHLDVDIKRTVRNNRCRLHKRIAGEMEGADQSNDNSLLERALELDRQKDGALTGVDPDDYTEFMCSLQRDPEVTPVVQVQFFDVPDTFRTSLTLTSRNKLNLMKAPGPDQLRTKIFKVTSALFADAVLELCRAIG